MPSRRRLEVPATEAVHVGAERLDASTPAELVELLQDDNRVAVEAVASVLPAIAREIRRIAAQLLLGGRLIYVGAGTSGRLGALDAAECPPTFGAPPEQVIALVAGGARALARAVEGVEDDAKAGVHQLAALRIRTTDFVCGIAASGTTPYVHGALREAKRRGAQTLLICCNPRLARSRIAQAVIAIPTGAELIAGSTRLKAGTATKLVLNALSTGAMVQLGKVFRGRMIDARATNAKLTTRAIRTLVELGPMTAARARALLGQAEHWPRLALAMHFSGQSAKLARQLLSEKSLRDLEQSSPKRRPARN